MIDVEEALSRLEAESGPLEVVERALSEARGLVLAAPVAADRDFPPTDRSAMDGYALRAQDVTVAGQELELAGEVRAGQPLGDLTLAPGRAARIMTGGSLPPGADTVVMVEHTAEDALGRRVRIDEVPRPGQHIRRRGEERRRGETAVEAGRPIGAGEVAALVSVGCTTVAVHRPPVVHVLSTGDEVVEPEQVPAEHQVRNSNTGAILAQLADLGLSGLALGIAGDAPGALDRLLSRGLAGDLLVVTGGVSAGKYDLVHQVLGASGMRTLFHKVRVKPGKPILAGRLGSCLVVGLPGNPVSGFTCFAVFVVPLLRRMLGYARWHNTRLHATLSEPLSGSPGRETYHLARLEVGSDGLAARRVACAGSGDVLALARANGFIVTPPEGASYAAGAVVSVLPRDPLWARVDSAV